MSGEKPRAGRAARCAGCARANLIQPERSGLAVTDVRGWRSAVRNFCRTAPAGCGRYGAAYRRPADADTRTWGRSSRVVRQASRYQAAAYSSSFPLDLRQSQPRSSRLAPDVRAKQHRPLHRRRHGVADRAVQPMVVQTRCAQFPLIQFPPAPRGLHAILGREMFREQTMVVAIGAHCRSNSDRHPGSPMGTARRAWMKLFQ